MTGGNSKRQAPWWEKIDLALLFRCTIDLRSLAAQSILKIIF